jgi:hypothetical protein
LEKIIIVYYQIRALYILHYFLNFEWHKRKV